MVIFLVFLTACNNRSSLPDHIIPVDSMQKIMMDVIMADEYAILYVNKDSLKHDKAKRNQELLDTIFAIHHVSREDFQASLRFYESRPDLNKNIFDSLAAYANRHRPDLYRPKPQPKPTAVHPK
jgi:hypothetical protein